MRMEAGVKSHKLLLIKILTAFFIGLAVLSCQNEKPIIIGFVGGTSGRAATWTGPRPPWAAEAAAGRRGPCPCGAARGGSGASARLTGSSSGQAWSLQRRAHGGTPGPAGAWSVRQGRVGHAYEGVISACSTSRSALRWGFGVRSSSGQAEVDHRRVLHTVR